MKNKKLNFKNIFPVFLLLLSIVLSISCASGPTSVEFTVLEPSEIDMSKYRNIAVPSTVSYKSWNYNYYNTYIPFSRGTWYDYNFRLLPYASYSTPLPNAIAEYTNNLLVSALQNTNYFNNIIYGSAADNIYNVLTVPGVSYESVIKANNIDAFITSEITKMYSNEYLDAEPVYTHEHYKDRNGNTRSRRVIDHYEFTLYQRVSVAVTYSVIDARSRAVIATRTVEDSMSKTTWITPYTRYSPSILPYYQGLLDGLNDNVLKALSPHKIIKVEELMDNDPKLDAYSDAWELVENNSIEMARDRFLDAWNSTRHIPSGYNAGILNYALGNYNAAINILQSVYDSSHNTDVAVKLSEIRSIKQMEDRAKRQL